MNWRVGLGTVLAAAIGLMPASAGAASHTFVDTRGYFPANQTEGPANIYPATIPVSGLAGTVTGVSVTMLSLETDNQLDMALVGPNGQAVMLLSDACSSSAVFGAFWRFEDGAPIFAPMACSQGVPTLFDSRARLMPSNYGNPEEDVFPGGPAGPISNKLASLAGGSPNGNWSLFMVDDKPSELGFSLGGWALHLEVTPPPPPPPTVVTVTVPVAATGKRAAALAKCKNKRTKAKKQACRANARKLPV